MTNGSSKGLRQVGCRRGEYRIRPTHVPQEGAAALKQVGIADPGGSASFALVPGARPFCKLFGFPQLTLGLEPKLFIPPRRSAVLFPDLPRPSSDTIFCRSRQSTGAPFQALRKRGNALRRFAVAHPTSEAAVLISLCENATDELLAIHANQQSTPANCSPAKSY